MISIRTITRHGRSAAGRARGHRMQPCAKVLLAGRKQLKSSDRTQQVTGSRDRPARLQRLARTHLTALMPKPRHSPAPLIQTSPVPVSAPTALGAPRQATPIAARAGAIRPQAAAASPAQPVGPSDIFMKLFITLAGRSPLRDIQVLVATCKAAAPSQCPIVVPAPAGLRLTAGAVCRPSAWGQVHAPRQWSGRNVPAIQNSMTFSPRKTPMARLANMFMTTVTSLAGLQEAAKAHVGLAPGRGCHGPLTATAEIPAKTLL